MDKKMKQFYQVPSIKVVAFKVEEGFQSQLGIGDPTRTQDYPNGRSGIQAFGDGGSYETVFGGRYTNSGE
jgi:hypothetical protein